MGSNITDDAAPSAITFSRLQNLRLSDLPSLRGFCSSGNCTVKFPPSMTLIVESCPVLKLKISPDGLLLQEGSDRQNESSIRGNYNQLNKELKQLFLLCGITLRGNYISFEDLFRYSMGLGYFEKAFKVEKARDVLHSWIKELRDTCLLTDNNDNTYVEMPTLVRDVANQIAFRDQHMLSLMEDGGDREFEDWSDKYFLEKCTIMSFPLGNQRFPEDMHCPSLKMFLLQGDPADNDLQKISPRFFEKMRNLQVLSLRCMTIPSLPPSFLFLKNLDSLCLDKCILGDVALIGELIYLEVLSLSGSDVKQLPKEVGRLTNLRLLDLTDCSELEVVSPGVISSLGRLEELRLRNSFSKWGVEGQSSNASLSELKHLSKLSALEVHIPNAGIIPANLFSHKLERSNIIIGDAYIWEKHMAMTTLNTLKVTLTTTIEELDEGLKFLVKRSEDLWLYADGMNDIFHSLDTKGLEHLQHLQLQSNIDFTHIINGKVVFPNLRTLRVDRSDHPGFVFSFSMPENLAELKHLEISACELMEEGLLLTGEQGQENIDNMFSKKDDLKLRELPNITRFCSGSIEKLELGGWVKLRDYDAAMRKDIEETHSKENHDAKSQLITYFLFDFKAVFPNLTILKVHGCGHLRLLFSISMAKSFVELKSLEISTCKIIEEIVSSTSEDGQENMENLFPKLEDLKLKELPKLTRFFSGNCTHIPSLEKMDIQGCTELAAFISDNNVLMSGKDSSIYEDQIEEKESEGKNSLNTIQYFLFDEKIRLPNLTSLVVQRCDGISFLASTARSLVQLKHLEISECQTMKVILKEEEYSEEIKDNMFPELKKLKLNDLPYLDRFSSRSCVEFASLEEFHIENCTQLDASICNPSSNSNACSNDFLSDKKVRFPKLKDLTIIGKRSEVLSLYADGMDNIFHSLDTKVFENLKLLQLQNNINIAHIIKRKIVFPNLRTLKVQRCDRPGFMFSFFMPKSLAELKHLQISTCKLMEESLSSTRDQSQENMDNMFSKQEELKLYESEQNVSRFCSGSIEKLASEGWVKLGADNAAMRNEIEENLDVRSKLISIQYFLFDLKVVFPNLTILKVHGCSHLRLLFSISMAKSLVELKSLEISTCEIIEEILSPANEDSQEKMENMFCKLEDLKLEKLPKLTRFCSGSYIKIPSLKKMDIQGCTKLATFISDNNVPMSGKDQIEEKESEGNNSLNTNSQLFLDKKIGLPKLKNLVVHGCDGLSFIASLEKSLVQVVQLKHIEISECQIMKAVFKEEYSEEINNNMSPEGSGSSVEFASLERLHIEKCTQLETFIFNPLSNSSASSHGFLFDKKVGFPTLKVLTIIGLPMLKTIWHTELARRPFSTLQEVTVQQCSSLRNILPDSFIASAFQQLEKLTVKECGVVEEIIFQGPENLEHHQFVFPNLIHLEFTSLIQLERLYPKMVSFSCPLLKTLKFLDCEKLYIFGAKFPGRQETLALRQLPTSSHSTLSSKLFTPAKKATLPTPAKQFSILIDESSFPKLEDLTFGPRSVNIWYGRPASAMGCETVVFAVMGNSDTHGYYQHLRTLRLHGLEKPTRLWQKTQPAGQEFPKLDILEVKFCGLTNQELSSLSFSNLTSLEVTLCWRLQYLTTYSVAQRLGKLKTLKVDECKSMRQILASDEGIGDDDSNCEIVFSQLQDLELRDLISLERFCSSNCTVKVPNLKNLEVNWCSVKLKSATGILEVDSDMPPDVQRSNSSKEILNITESSSSSGKSQKQPATSASEGAEHEHIEVNALELHDDSLTDEPNKDESPLPGIDEIEREFVRVRERVREFKRELESSRESSREVVIREFERELESSREVVIREFGRVRESE